ncbi:hypothetical protein M0D69_13835 [Caballeronia sp. SEWSISQ10-4 2]|uniref:hypothetical protein n=1 Tax=Caballeronia sp. SEWSISQ10-4 2 TaxID=2937438 RepID=UPI002650F3E7|nr:hypothetical protein [Caballeronia sp. SEWSISQ10-4 2]MDN7179074.1 hypothetical protein [Caballeronia sp. SEWSISQ10-4 2]
MLFEIINPSDPYTVVAEDKEIAAVACVVLGAGSYAFRPIDGGEFEVPLFLFGRHAEWFKATFDATTTEVIDRVMDARRAELADCLDSVLYGDAEMRARFESDTANDTPKQRYAAKLAFQKQASSLNDIGMNAYRTAVQLRGSPTDVTPPLPTSAPAHVPPAPETPITEEERAAILANLKPQQSD